MQGKMSSGIDTNMIIAGIVIAIIVLGLIFVFMGRKNQENFADGKTYQFMTARAGHGKASCVLTNSGEPKDAEEKEISKEKCTIGDKKGWWVCNEVKYDTEGHTRRGCGCLYETSENDKYNLLKNES